MREKDVTSKPAGGSKTGEEVPVDGGGAGKHGWVSPRYSVSRSLQLDPAQLVQRRCVGFAGDAAEAEAYRVLRTRIMHRREASRNTIMITSALPGEGKTLTAINLALTFAKEFSQTVLLVDCDLRRQSIHEILGYSGNKGLVNHLLDGEALADLIVWPGIEKLTVISGGRTLNDSSEFLGSPGMKTLVQELKSRYPERLVIFDVPPVLVGADALAFAPLVDYIIFVVRAEQTSGKEVRKAVSLLPQDKLLGLVLNASTCKGEAKYPKAYLANSRDGKG